MVLLLLEVLLSLNLKAKHYDQTPGSTAGLIKIFCQFSRVYAGYKKILKITKQIVPKLRP